MVGGRSQGFRPRRRRLSLRRGGIAVVAAVRSDPAAVSQCALFLLPHVSTVSSCPEGFSFLLLCPFLRERDNRVANISRGSPRSLHLAILQCYECDDDDGPMRDGVRVW